MKNLIKKTKKDNEVYNNNGNPNEVSLKNKRG